MFSMVVTEELDVWPEQHRRTRYWVRVYPLFCAYLFFCAPSLSYLCNILGPLGDAVTHVGRAVNHILFPL